MKQVFTLLLLIVMSLPGYGDAVQENDRHETLAFIAASDIFQNTRTKTAMRDIVLRLKNDYPADTLLRITPTEVAALFNHKERRILSEQYLSFTVNTPVTAYVAVFSKQLDDLFWLAERGFEKTALTLRASGETLSLWKKDFSQGKLGLGVHSLSRRGDQYFVILLPKDPTKSLKVSAISPALHNQTIARKGALYLADDIYEVIESLPPLLDGQVLIRGNDSRQQEGHLAGFFRKTAHQSTKNPDQIVLTITEHPENSMGIQWRTHTSIAQGTVRYQIKDLAQPIPSATFMESLAQTIVIEDIGLIEDASNHRHLVTLKNLAPDTTYVYSVGSGEHWSEFNEFKTAPSTAAPFSFFYMGDIQAGYDKWRPLALTAKKMAPEAAFCLTAGDQINRGGERNDWDSFFHYADGIFADLAIVPAVGNHELYRNEPRLYLNLLQLPENGDSKIELERTYSFEYSNLLVISLDANIPLTQQTDWLAQQLAASKATWKIVLFHQPLYSVESERENPKDGYLWSDIFDQYEVDVIFQGHDHGYMRSHPLKNGQIVSATEGSIYVVSNAGWKMYDSRARDYCAVVVDRTPMYQVIDVKLNPDRFVFKAYNKDGVQLDEFAIEK